jgi:hypothetical protein
MATHLFSSLFSSLLSCFRSLLPRKAGVPTMHSLRASSSGMHPGRPSCGSFSRRPLRVVRSSSRLVISGRMADVCAELDRLAAMEG